MVLVAMLALAIPAWCQEQTVVMVASLYPVSRLAELSHPTLQAPRCFDDLCPSTQTDWGSHRVSIFVLVGECDSNGYGSAERLRSQ